MYKKGYIIIYNNPDITRAINNCTLASKEEKNKLLSALIREGYKYDKGQHKLVKWKFKPFDKVLVRDSNTDIWFCSLFSYYETQGETAYPYTTTSGSYKYCIPYEGNEYLLGTTDSPI